MAAIHDHVAANKAHYHVHAHEYDAIPFANERTERTVEAILKLYAFDEKTTTVMEYACGTGLVSKNLAPLCKHIVGVDISQAMVDVYNNKRNGLERQNMNAVCAELKGEAGELGDEKFDVIVCTSAYHHFTSIDDATRILAYFLKPSGTLLVVDVMKGGYCNARFAKPVDASMVPHIDGIDESDMRTAFESAGLSFSFDAEGLKEGGHDHDGHKHDADLFIAKGVKL